MDGNSSWAKANNIPQMDGYLKGMKTMAYTILHAKEIGIKYLTFYAFSSENWQRPKLWVSNFMNLALNFFRKDPLIKSVLNINPKLKVIGNKTKLPTEFQEILNKYEKETQNNKDIIIQIALSYGSKEEIIRAMKKMQQLDLEFTEENLTKNLDTAGIPDPDMIIRTSGKQRLSNFLLWQASYSELYFSEVFWPEFDKIELEKAIKEFYNRKRTYGK